MSRHMRVDQAAAHEINRALVFDLLRRHPVISQAELVRESGLSRATISQIVEDFTREALVRSRGLGTSSGGRPPTLLEFDPRARFAIGVELGNSACAAVITDLNAEPVSWARSSGHTGNPDAALAMATTLVAELLRNLPAQGVLGIGVGTPGLADPQSGIIVVAPDLGWRDVPVGKPLADRFSLPVAVVNRAKAAALAEAWRGAGQKADPLVYVSLGTGISAGIVIGERLYRGATLSEGAIGHMTMDLDGPLCHCGNRGCLQAIVGSDALLARIRSAYYESDVSGADQDDQAHLEIMSLAGVAVAAQAGNPIVLGVLAEAAAYIGTGTANLINILNPQMLILGGPLIRALPALVPAIRAEVQRRAFSSAAASLDVLQSELGADVVPIGAAAFLMSQVSAVGSRGIGPIPAVRPSVVFPPSAG